MASVFIQLFKEGAKRFRKIEASLSGTKKQEHCLEFKALKCLLFLPGQPTVKSKSGLDNRGKGIHREME